MSGMAYNTAGMVVILKTFPAAGLLLRTASDSARGASYSGAILRALLAWHAGCALHLW